MIREDGRSIFSLIYAIESNRMKCIPRALQQRRMKTITIFLVGPVLYPALAIADFKRGRAKGAAGDCQVDRDEAARHSLVRGAAAECAVNYFAPLLSRLSR